MLCTARTPSLLYGSTLAFKTLRTGFPKATIEVWDNASYPECATAIERHAYDVGASFIRLPGRTTHHQWMRSVLYRENGPMVFVDPDVVFFDEMESVTLKSFLTGRLCPAYYNEVVGCNEVERLHTCLLFVSNPKLLRTELDRHSSCERYPWDWVSPRKTARKGKVYFHDTMAIAFGAIGGKAITAEYLERFGHLVSGSMIDLVAPKMTEGKDLAALHRAAYLDNNVLRGCWANHDKFYAAHPPI